jgi:predicted dehydrogenase
VSHDFGIPLVADPAVLVGHPDVQAVVVCSETATHRRWAELAARHGRHVLCEKPLATTLEDANAIVAACRDAGVQLHQAFVARFLPAVARARALVREGRLGDLVGMVGHNHGRPPLPPAYAPWITDVELAGGGALIDHSVHVVDAMRHVTGLEVEAVSAEAGSLLWDCGVDDVALLSLRFSGGAVASVDPSWSVPADSPADYDFALRLVGAEGSLDVNDAADTLEVVRDGDGPRGLRRVGFGADADLAMVRAFIASIRAGRVLQPCATGEDGVRALEAALAAYASAEGGQPVGLPATR